MDHRAPLMMKDSEPQLWQACPFCVITLRRHHACSPEGYICAAYHAAYPSALRSVAMPFLENATSTRLGGQSTEQGRGVVHSCRRFGL